MRSTSTTITTQRHRVARRRGGRRLAGGLWVVLALAGCENVPPVATFEPVTDPEQLFLSLTLNHRAVNLSMAAPYDTLQLVATPRNGRGEPMAGLPEPTFLSLDTTRVWVTPDGRLEARQAATGVRVIAEILAEGNNRHADTAWVNVTADSAPPELATFSITPESPEAAVWTVLPRLVSVPQVILRQAGVDVAPDPVLPLRALDANGDPIPGLRIEYESIDPLIAEVHPTNGVITAKAPGVAIIVARTLAYGVAKVDTARFTVTLPVLHVVAWEKQPTFNGTTFIVREVFGPEGVRIRQGGYVFWANSWDTPVDVRFDDPANVAGIPEACAHWGGTMCGAGDIPAFQRTPELPGGTSVGLVGRRFPVPGVYEYESTLTGHTGRVVVVADSTS